MEVSSKAMDRINGRSTIGLQDSCALQVAHNAGSRTAAKLHAINYNVGGNKTDICLL